MNFLLVINLSDGAFFCGQMLGLAGEILKLNGQVFGQLVDSSQPRRTFRSRTKEQAILRLDPVSGDLLLGILLFGQIRISCNISGLALLCSAR